MELLNCLSLLNKKRVVLSVEQSTDYISCISLTLEKEKEIYITCDKDRVEMNIKKLLFQQIQAEFVNSFKESKYKVEIYIHLLDSNDCEKFSSCDINSSKLQATFRIDCNPENLLTTLQRLRKINLDSITNLAKMQFIYSEEYMDANLNYNLRYLLNMLNVEFNNSDAMIISKNGKVFFQDCDTQCYIFWTPPEGTVFEHAKSNLKFLITGESAIEISNTKQTSSESVKYAFYRFSYSLYDDDDSELAAQLKKYKVDRLINQNGHMFWYDDISKKIVRSSVKDFEFIDNQTQRHVSIVNGVIYFCDPDTRVAIGTFGGIESVDYCLQRNLLYSTTLWKDGEYTDVVTKKKFSMKDGKIVPDIEKAKIYIVADLDKDHMKEALLKIHVETEQKCLVNLDKSRWYTLNSEKEIEEYHMPTGFEFVENFTQKRYTITDNGYTASRI